MKLRMFLIMLGATFLVTGCYDPYPYATSLVDRNDAILKELGEIDPEIEIRRAAFNEAEGELKDYLLNLTDSELEIYFRVCNYKTLGTPESEIRMYKAIGEFLPETRIRLFDPNGLYMAFQQAAVSLVVLLDKRDSLLEEHRLIKQKAEKWLLASEAERSTPVIYQPPSPNYLYDDSFRQNQQLNNQLSQIGSSLDNIDRNLQPKMVFPPMPLVDMKKYRRY